MSRILTDEQVAGFERDGFVFPIRVMSTAEAAGYRQVLEAYEATSGGPIRSNWRHNVHLLFTWANELVRHPRILDAVEDVLGPDILCWITNFFIKEPHDPAFVSWHQDSTYWGLDPNDVVSAWVALSDAPVASGAMKMIPGSHKWEQQPHNDTFHENNLLSRGQVIATELDEQAAVAVPLQAGEISLHHIRIVHGSEPNTTGDRRIGLAIRYIPSYVRQTKSSNDGATLVRGVDNYGHFAPDPAPVADLDEATIAAHAWSIERLMAALMDGTEADSFRA